MNAKMNKIKFMKHHIKDKSSQMLPNQSMPIFLLYEYRNISYIPIYVFDCCAQFSGVISFPLEVFNLRLTE